MWIFIYLLLPSLAICCEDYWAEYDGYCYRRFSTEKWLSERANRANYICRGYGGHLASIKSYSELNFVKSLTQSGKSATMMLQTAIGAYRTSSYAAWKWFDGTPFNENYLFESGGPYADGLCAYLISDKLAILWKRLSENPSELHFSGRTGMIVAGSCSNSARVFVCKKKDTTNRRTERMCGSTWTALGSNCYKKFSVPTITVRESENHCRSNGAHLVSVTTEEEKDLVIGMTHWNYPKYWEEQTIVGCYRESSRHPWKWYDGTPFNQTDWFYPDMISNENCCQLFPDFCVIPGKEGQDDQYYYHGATGKFCTADCNFKAHEFVCEKKGCDLSVSTLSGGRCVCNNGLVDITETSLLEAKNYAKGEKCIPNQCHIKKDTSVLFMIDSSESITKGHWPKMLNFIKSAANRIPTKFRVGFLKFSTKVSKGKWISPGWTASDFHEAIPSKYDGEDTNTPAVLKRARKMFENYKSDEKIAVLITDGLPFSKDYNSEDEAQKATVNAAKNLQKDDVRLIVMGMGPQIFSGEERVMEWVKKPERDFHLNLEDVGLLQEKDMDILVNMVCQ